MSMSAGSIPVVINSFNQPSYLRMMVNQLSALGVDNLVIIDQASTSPELLSLLDELKHRYPVVKLADNNGPHWFFLSRFFELLPPRFVYTDADLLFSAQLKSGFIDTMDAVLDDLSAIKVGLALDISQPADMIRADFSIGGQLYTIQSWEAQFWKERVPSATGLEVYRAPVDTTFALYDRDRFKQQVDRMRPHGRFSCMDTPGSYRLAGEFVAVHLPWMRDNRIPSAEWAAYLAGRGDIHAY